MDRCRVRPERLRNKVLPSGELDDHKSRTGTLMGNRGCLHDDHWNVVRRWRGKRWVCCVLNDPRLPPRELMTPGLYTELFFLDEATALAAGHRPCHYCRRDESRRFFATWALTHPDWPVVSATTVDAQLHTERTERPGILVDDVRKLPAGTIVRDSRPHGFLLVHRRGLLPWSFEGYGAPVSAASIPDDLSLVTPPSIVKLFTAGYPVKLHPSAGG